MTRWRTCALAAAAALLGSAGAARAQATDAFARPRYSLSFSSESGGGIAFGLRVSPRTDVGIAVSGNRLSSSAYGVTPPSDTSRSLSTGLSLDVSLKRYLGQGGPIAPYGYVAAFGSRGTMRWFSPNDPRSLGTEVGLDVGAGADWFVAPRVSIGGRFVASGGVTRRRNRMDGIPDTFVRGWVLSTGATSVQATLYI